MTGRRTTPTGETEGVEEKEGVTLGDAPVLIDDVVDGVFEPVPESDSVLDTVGLIVDELVLVTLGV